MLQRRKKLHGRTIQQLASGLGVAVDELFADPNALARRVFDRATNPEVDEVIEKNPQLFRRWSQSEFNDLYIRLSHGGVLTPDGVLEAVRLIIRRRVLFAKSCS